MTYRPLQIATFIGPDRKHMVPYNTGDPVVIIENPNPQQSYYRTAQPTEYARDFFCWAVPPEYLAPWEGEWEWRLSVRDNRGDYHVFNGPERQAVLLNATRMCQRRDRRPVWSFGPHQAPTIQQESRDVDFLYRTPPNYIQLCMGVPA